MHQFQSPNKTNDSCFRCNELGHWADNCPKSPNLRSPTSYPSSTSEYPATHCPCGAGLCEIRISNSRNNPDRKYYSCPGKFEYRCTYFKWCDRLSEEEILRVQPKPYPICGCGAGVCRVEVQIYGPNAGISYFVCHIQKGYGACNFRLCKDDVPESPLGEDQEFDCLTPEVIEMLDAAEMRAHVFSLEKNHVQMENRVDGSSDVAESPLGEDQEFDVPEYDVPNFRRCEDDVPESPLGEDQVLDCLTPEVIEMLDAAEMHARAFSLEKNHVQMENRVDGSSDVAHGSSSEFFGLHSHSFTNKNSENTVVSELADENDELLLLMDSQVENVEASINTVVATHQSPISQGFNPLNIPEENLPSEEGALSLDELVPKQPVPKDDLLDALRKLSLCLQKDFISFSDSVGPKNHTFAPLDYLRADYGLFHLQTIEYIKQATAHACIEQAVKDDATSREAVDRYKKEKAKFEEIFRSFCEALKAYKASNDQLMSVREKISCDRNKLVELEEEEFCCEVENAACKELLTQIAKNMSECKERMQAAYQEVEDALKQSNYSKEGD